MVNWSTLFFLVSKKIRKKEQLNEEKDLSWIKMHQPRVWEFTRSRVRMYGWRFMAMGDREKETGFHWIWKVTGSCWLQQSAVSEGAVGGTQGGEEETSASYSFKKFHWEGRERQREIARERNSEVRSENCDSFVKAGKARICCQDEGRVRRERGASDIWDDTKEKPWRRWRGCKQRIPGSQVRGRASPGDEQLRYVLQKRLECSCMDTYDRT